MRASFCDIKSDTCLQFPSLLWHTVCSTSNLRLWAMYGLMLASKEFLSLEEVPQVADLPQAKRKLDTLKVEGTVQLPAT